MGCSRGHRTDIDSPHHNDEEIFPNHFFVSESPVPVFFKIDGIIKIFWPFENTTTALHQK